MPRVISEEVIGKWGMSAFGLHHRMLLNCSNAMVGHHARRRLPLIDPILCTYRIEYIVIEKDDLLTPEEHARLQRISKYMLSDELLGPSFACSKEEEGGACRYLTVLAMLRNFWLRN